MSADSPNWTPSAALQKVKAELDRRPRPLKVLVVEDNVDDAFFIWGIVEGACGCEMVEVQDAASGINALSTPHNFDLALVDIRLGPPKDGLDLINETRPKNPKVQYVAITGLDLPMARGDLADLGVPLVSKSVLDLALNYLLKHDAKI